MAKVDDDRAHLEDRVRTALRTQQPRIMRWYKPEATGLEERARRFLDNPRAYLARVPGRLACRFLRRHNWTCIGLTSTRHPNRW
ncbi:hypothetical protein [Streptomyces ossamyceticus]|uniref:hypothetical protein n=1 Tax=Streptomyces ossamyceticus TaxID=249581 RepID=UPI003426D063